MIERLLQWGVVCIWLATCNAYASVVLQIDGNGILTGATSVNVEGATYDVAFKEGTCFLLFPECNPYCPTIFTSTPCPPPLEFIFTSITVASSASQALLDQVFIGEYDYMPQSIRGCETSPEACLIHTPFFTVPGYVFVHPSVSLHVLYSAAVAENWNPDFGSDGVADFSGPRGFGPHVFALWSLHANEAPEPSTITVLAAGLLALFMQRRSLKNGRNRDLRRLDSSV